MELYFICNESWAHCTIESIDGKEGIIAKKVIKAPVQVGWYVEHLRFKTEILIDMLIVLVDEEDSYRIIGGCYPGCGSFDNLLSKTLGQPSAQS